MLKSNQRKNRCNLCNAVFKTELEENNHMIYHARPKPGIHCTKCFEIFSSEKELKYHQPCIGKETFDIQNYIQLHESSQGYLKRVLVNSSRKPQLPNGRLRLNHFKRPKNKVRYNKVKCPLCKRNFSQLKFHIIHKHAKQVFPLVCNICKKAEPNQEYFTTHVMSHVEYSENIHEPNPKHMCPTCFKLFKYRRHMNRHILNHHRSLSPPLKSVVANTKTNNAKTSPLHLVDYNNSYTDSKLSNTYIVATKHSKTCYINVSENDAGDKTSKETTRILEKTIKSESKEVSEIDGHICEDLILLSHLTVYACSTCTKQFPNIEKLKEHVIVHI